MALTLMDKLSLTSFAIGTSLAISDLACRFFNDDFGENSLTTPAATGIILGSAGLIYSGIRQILSKSRESYLPTEYKL